MSIIMPTTVIQKPFCVIGHVQGTSNQCARTWFHDEDAAAKHAAALLQRTDNVRKALGELYVVQIGLVVRHPINYEIVRAVLP